MMRHIFFAVTSLFNVALPALLKTATWKTSFAKSTQIVVLLFMVWLLWFGRPPIYRNSAELGRSPYHCP